MITISEASVRHSEVVSSLDQEAEDVALVTAMKKAEAGDSDGLAEVYDLIATDLYRLALWRCGSVEDAADVVQDVFVELARRSRRLGEIRKPRSYLLSMAHRAAVRVSRRRRADSPLDVALVVASEADVRREAEARLCSQQLLALPAAQREAVYLRWFEGMTFKEIGNVARVPTFTAASRFRLGMARLRRLLGVEGAE